MLSIFNLQARSNVTFRFTRDFTAFAATHDMTAGTLRMEARRSKAGAVVYSWDWTYSAATHLGVATAPQADMEAFADSSLQYDCVFETADGIEPVFRGRLTFSDGVTVPGIGASGVGVNGDTVFVEGEPPWAVGVIPVDLAAAISATQAARDAAIEAAQAAASLRSVLASGGVAFLSPDDDHSTQFAISNQPGATNNWMAVGGQVGFPATLVTVGSGANINGNIAAKGKGAINFGNGSGQLFQAKDPDTGNPVVAYPVVVPSTGYGSPVILTAGGYANAGVSIQGAGTSGASIGPGHITSNVGSYSAGRYCNVSGYAAGALGNACSSSANYSVTMGQYANDWSVTCRAFSSSYLGSSGASGIKDYHLVCLTSGTTPGNACTQNTLTLGASPTSLTQVRLMPNSSMTADFSVNARNTATGSTAAWFGRFSAQQGSTYSSTTLVGSSGAGAPTFSSGTGSSWALGLSADTANGCVAFTCTGAGTESIRWAVRVSNVEITN